MTSDEDRRRERGIELNGLLDRLDADTFPIGVEELLDEYGAHELGFPDDDTSTLETVLGPAGVTEFRSADELLETIRLMVGSSAVGQEGQTGRGTSDTTPPAEHRPPGKPESETETDRSL